jgi:hypothetical protein
VPWWAPSPRTWWRRISIRCPRSHPDSLIVLPYVGIAFGLLATVIASVVGALLADRSARRVPLGEVLRVAE